MRPSTPAASGLRFSGRLLPMKIDRAGYPFIAGALVPALGLALARRYGVGHCRSRLLGGFFAYFFRDPDRTVPQATRARGLAGRRQGDDRRAERRPLGPARRRGSRSRSSCRRWTCTSTARRSAAGSRAIDYRPGSSCRPTRKRSNDNELNEIWIDSDGRTIVFRQVVGMLARRIVCRVARGRRGRARRADRPDEVRIADGRVPAARRSRSSSRSASTWSAAKRSWRATARAAACRAGCRVTCVTAAAAAAGRPAAALQARRLPAAVDVHGRQPVLRLRLRRLRHAAGLRHRGGAHRHRDGARHARRVRRAADQDLVGVRRAARLARRRRLVRAGAGDPGVHVGAVAAEAARMGGGVHLS